MIAALLRPGDAVLLEGPLGAGKSALARALLRALAGDPALDVPSPSYTLVQEYETAIGPVAHFDLWRLDGPADLAELGWDEARQGVVLVEWPDRLGAAPPRRCADHRPASRGGWANCPARWLARPDRAARMSPPRQDRTP